MLQSDLGHKPTGRVGMPDSTRGDCAGKWLRGGRPIQAESSFFVRRFDCRFGLAGGGSGTTYESITWDGLWRYSCVPEGVVVVTRIVT